MAAQVEEGEGEGEKSGKGKSNPFSLPSSFDVCHADYHKLFLTNF